MRLLVLQRQLALAACVALLDICVHAPTDAQASCGDYVRMRAERTAAQPGRLAQQPHKPTSNERPCDGPSCRRGPVTDAPTAPRTPIAAEHWAVFAIVPALLHEPTVAFQRDQGCGTPGANPSGVFRPPK